LISSGRNTFEKKFTSLPHTPARLHRGASRMPYKPLSLLERLEGINSPKRHRINAIIGLIG
jgi:hypothetical protein